MDIFPPQNGLLFSIIKSTLLYGYDSPITFVYCLYLPTFTWRKYKRLSVQILSPIDISVKELTKFQVVTEL